MQGSYRSNWPKRGPKEKKIEIINFVKKMEKRRYKSANSRYEYFRSITSSITVIQRKLFRDQTSIIEECQPYFPTWMNIPKVPPPLPVGRKDI
jgi:hypothetical protein